MSLECFNIAVNSPKLISFCRLVTPLDTMSDYSNSNIFRDEKMLIL